MILKKKINLVSNPKTQYLDYFEHENKEPKLQVQLLTLQQRQLEPKEKKPDQLYH